MCSSLLWVLVQPHHWAESLDSYSRTEEALLLSEGTVWCGNYISEIGTIPFK